MDGLGLLDRASAAGLRVAGVGDDLVLTGSRSCASLAGEIARKKAEVLAELAGRSPAAEASWSRLAGQRWADASRTSGIDVPGRLDDLPSVREMLARDRSTGSPVVATPAPPPGCPPVEVEDLPAWIEDPSLSIRVADVRASIEDHLATLQAEAPATRHPGRTSHELVRAEANLQAMEDVRAQADPSNLTSSDHPSDTNLEVRPCPRSL